MRAFVSAVAWDVGAVAVMEVAGPESAARGGGF